jgi:hypothetical protein
MSRAPVMRTNFLSTGARYANYVEAGSEFVVKRKYFRTVRVVRSRPPNAAVATIVAAACSYA